MHPAAICSTYLGQEKVAELLAQLSSPQIKAVLKSGGLRVKLAGGFVSQQKRKSVWTGRIAAAIAESNDEAASELLQQWLLNHRRPMLIDYLDRLGVKHSAGETDSSFLLAGDPDKARECATSLLKSYPEGEVAAYLAYIAYQQKATVFDAWEPLQSVGRPADPTAKPTLPA